MRKSNLPTAPVSDGSGEGLVTSNSSPVSDSSGEGLVPSSSTPASDSSGEGLVTSTSSFTESLVVTVLLSRTEILNKSN